MDYNNDHFVDKTLKNILDITNMTNILAKLRIIFLIVIKDISFH